MKQILVWMIWACVILFIVLTVTGMFFQAKKADIDENGNFNVLTKLYSIGTDLKIIAVWCGVVGVFCICIRLFLCFAEYFFRR